MRLEDDLKRALRAQAPPAAFASRVMERIEAGEPVAAPKRKWWRAAAASVVLAAMLGGYATHKIAEHRRGERAKEQVLTAMKIAGEKVRYAQQEVQAIGTHD